MIQILVALAAEARPLIDHYRLERLEPGAFPVYAGDDVRLVVSGVGAFRAAAAAAYLHATSGEEPLAVWVNVGIAGHRSHAPGELFAAHSVAHESDPRRFYPSPVGLGDLATCAVRTVTTPETEFPSDELFEMEAFGFYDQALRTSTAELVHCLKVVSDNRETGTSGLGAAEVTKRIASRLDRIESTLDGLRALARELEPHREGAPATDDFERRWRFTVSQRRELERLLSAHRTLGRVPGPDELGDARTAREALAALSRSAIERARERRGYA